MNILKPVMRCVFISTLIISHTTLANSSIYKKVNTDGTVVYSDRYFPGAQLVSIDASTLVIPSSKPLTTPSLTTNNPQQRHSITISTPAKDKHTFRDNNGNISLVVSLEPNTGGYFELHLNQKVYQSPTGVFNLENLDRGEYEYSFKFIDKTGKVIASTPVRYFYLHRASVLFNR